MLLKFYVSRELGTNMAACDSLKYIANRYKSLHFSYNFNIADRTSILARMWFLTVTEIKQDSYITQP